MISSMVPLRFTKGYTLQLSVLWQSMLGLDLEPFLIFLVCVAPVAGRSNVQALQNEFILQGRLYTSPPLQAAVSAYAFLGSY